MYQYRWEVFQQYQWNRYHKYQRNNRLHELIDSQYHHLIDDYDQEHGIILAEGLPVEIYQSPMMRPPNVKTAFPLINYTPEKIEDVPAEWYTGDKMFITIFNFEDKTDPTYDNPDMVRHIIHAIRRNHKLRDKQIEKKKEKAAEKGKEFRDKDDLTHKYQIVYWPANTTKNQQYLEDLFDA
mmetsp:Transcript_8743/g.6472  ORF Transcript_8743/g.6472 Transcript_8743/m.6472 type:complete len:181 (+) Transcript_8743:565-1107(+)